MVDKLSNMLIDIAELRTALLTAAHRPYPRPAQSLQEVVSAVFPLYAYEVLTIKL